MTGALSVLLLIGRLAAVTAADEAGHGFVDGNHGGGAIAAEWVRLLVLRRMGVFLIYSWPEKAFWLSEASRSASTALL